MRNINYLQKARIYTYKKLTPDTIKMQAEIAKNSQILYVADKYTKLMQFPLCVISLGRHCHKTPKIQQKNAGSKVALRFYVRLKINYSFVN